MLRSGLEMLYKNKGVEFKNRERSSYGSCALHLKLLQETCMPIIIRVVLTYVDKVTLRTRYALYQMKRNKVE